MRPLWEDRTSVLIRDWVEPVVPVFELATYLGDGAVLLVAGVLYYWFGHSPTARERAFVIAVGVAALAVSAGIKGVFMLPRPTLVFSPTAYPGYTFPSAHAVGSAAFFGALAVTLDLWNRYRQVLVASVVVATISLSRVVIGVHYLGDVVVGAGLGALVVWLGMRWREEGRFRPLLLFLLAAMIAIGTALLGSREFVTLTIGSGIGGACGWVLVADRHTTTSVPAILLLGVGGVGGILTIRIVGWLTGPPPIGNVLPFLLEILGYAMLTAYVLAVPLIATTIDDHSLVVRLEHTLPRPLRSVPSSRGELR